MHVDPDKLSLAELQALIAARQRATREPREQVNLLLPKRFAAWLRARCLAKGERIYAHEVLRLVALGLAAESVGLAPLTEAELPWRAAGADAPAKPAKPAEPAYVQITDAPAPRVDPAALAEALGARPATPTEVAALPHPPVFNVPKVKE